MAKVAENGRLWETAASMTRIGSANLQCAESIAPQGERQDDCVANRKTLSRRREGPAKLSSEVGSPRPARHSQTGTGVRPEPTPSASWLQSAAHEVGEAELQLPAERV